MPPMFSLSPNANLLFSGLCISLHDVNKCGKLGATVRARASVRVKDSWD